MRINRPTRSAGFTMMEMLVVIAIIVVLAGLTLGGMNYVNQKQAREKAKVQIGLLQMALEEYKADHGEYPSFPRTNGEGGTATIVDALFPESSNEKVYLAELDPDQDGQGWRQGDDIIDPWGNEYLYRTNRSSGSATAMNPDFDLWSAGPDGETSVGRGEYDPKDEDNLDDIRGW